METKKSVTKRKALSKWEAQEIVFTIEMRRGRDVWQGISLQTQQITAGPAERIFNFLNF